MKRPADTRPSFTDPEGLRATLQRLHAAGEQSWRDDSEAAELLRYTMDKYGALARKHHLEPEDAAVVATTPVSPLGASDVDAPAAVVVAPAEDESSSSPEHPAATAAATSSPAMPRRQAVRRDVIDLMLPPRVRATAGRHLLARCASVR